MSQAIDWKSRYRDFLHESEAREYQLRAHTQSLRRLLLRDLLRADWPVVAVVR